LVLISGTGNPCLVLSYFNSQKFIGSRAASRRVAGCKNEEELSSCLRIKEKYEEMAKKV
jgi:hypothetical protein